ncbi:MAG TPA: hypothetical protein VIK74_03035 [Parasegetibacter sp.]
MLKNNTILKVFLSVIFAVSVSVLTAQNITSPQVKAYPVSQMQEKVSNSIGSKKTLVSLDKLSAAYQHSTWYYQGKLNSNPRINSLVLNGMISIAGTPFDFQAVDFASTSVSSNTIKLAKLRFNKEQMLSSLQGKLKEIADLESLLGSNFIDLVTERQLLVDRIKEAFKASINFPSAEFTLITNKIFSDAEIFKLGPVAAFDKLASSLRDSLANYHFQRRIFWQC